jgi:glycerophosphoryl diester phosphodiesterase family protein
MSPIRKLLSHRLRGFGQVEHTVSALKAGCVSECPFLELDVRTSLDGEKFLWHDVRTGKLGDVDLDFATTRAKELSRVRYQNGEAILTLHDALRIFVSESRPDQKLCLDIKDFGFEESYLQMVREADLESRVCFISWIPQTLLRLHALETTAPLVLSCCNLMKLGPLGAVLDGLIANWRLRLGWIVFLGRNQATSPLGSLAHGFQHGYFCRRLPAPLLEAITASHGGICIHRSLTGHKLADYCRDVGLQMWVFSTETTEEYLRYASATEINVVFCDDAPTVIEGLKGNHASSAG